MKKIFLLIGFAMLLISSCEKDTTTGSSNTDPADGISHEESSDYIWDSSSESEINFDGSSITTNSSNVTINGSIATITSAGNYKISGNSGSAQLIVNAAETELIRLIFNGISLTNSTGPSVLIENSLKTIVVLTAGTQSTLSDGQSYSAADDDPNAALFSKSDLTITGTGSLVVNGKYKDGITSKDGLVVKEGQLTVTATDDGIRGKDYLIVKSGTLTINSGGDGLKSDNDANTAAGYILIEDGDIQITSAADGITAQTTVTVEAGNLVLKTGGGSTSAVSGDASAKGIKGLTGVALSLQTCTINSADDAIHSNNAVEIHAGEYTLSTADDGIHADATVTINAGTITILKSNEGVESHIITVNNGTISVVSSDDSFNATAGTRTEQDDKSYIYIKGGHITLNGSAGDPLDSNGSIVMTAGTVVIHGPSSQPEVAIDYNVTFNISGGLLVAAGTSSNMTQAPGSSSAQNSLRLMYKSSLAASTLFHLTDASGKQICTFKPSRKYQSIVFSSPDLVKGTTYNIYQSGSSDGIDTNGLITGGTYTPGTLVKSFTLSSTLTSLTNL